MQFLNDERINLEDGEIKLTMRPVSTSQQTRLVELASQHGISARVALAGFCLKSCIEKISISDVAYEPIKLADRADISDESTLSVLIKLGEMVTKAAFARVDDLKK
jgi:hypothetical protein